MAILFEKTAAYRDTGGLHASGIFDAEGNILCLAADTGRHNTLDKVIGRALLDGIDRGATFLATTGRLAWEMTSKISRAGIPVAATKTSVTANGLEVAENSGLTVIGFVRDRGSSMYTDSELRIFEKRQMRIYSLPERII
jgi:FdhD protein